jgi:hypothetical protein
MRPALRSHSTYSKQQQQQFVALAAVATGVTAEHKIGQKQMLID